jgi:predicted MFS family arabinose efflux permease
VAHEWRFVLATFAASGIGYLGSSAAPVIVQALIDAGLSHRQAGDLGTFELTALALTSMLVTPYVPRVSHRRLAVGGALLAALGVGISALAESYLPMVLGRLIIGTGSGLAIAGANAAIAAREDAERIFAIIWTMGGGITALLAIQLPHVVEGGNYPLGFGVLLVLSLAAAPFMLWIPPRPERFAGDAAVVAAVATGEALGAVEALRHPSSPESARPFGPLVLLTLSGIFFYSLSEMALWQFSFDIAVEHGIPYEHVGYYLGITGFVGLSGGAVAAYIGVRFRRIVPILVGSLLSVAGRWTYIVATSPEVLAPAALLWGIGFYFVGPYQIGLAAALDRRGRVAVAATALINLGYGLGPTLGGRIRQFQLDQGLGDTILVAAIAGTTLLSMLLLLPVAVWMDRRTLEPGQ